VVEGVRALEWGRFKKGRRRGVVGQAAQLSAYLTHRSMRPRCCRRMRYLHCQVTHPRATGSAVRGSCPSFCDQQTAGVTGGILYMAEQCTCILTVYTFVTVSAKQMRRVQLDT